MRHIIGHYSRFLTGFLCAVAFWMPMRTVDATDIMVVTTREIVETMARGVYAECVANEARAVEKYGGNIFTFTEFRVLERIYGKIGDTFMLRLFGGRVRDTVIEVPLMPRFSVGERVLLLLGEDNKDGHPLVEIQGVFRIKDDPSGGEPRVVTPVAGMTLYRATDDRRYDKQPAYLSLADFSHSVRKIRNDIQKNSKMETGK